jgi:hypothetical protein
VTHLDDMRDYIDKALIVENERSERDSIGELRFTV